MTEEPVPVDGAWIRQRRRLHDITQEDLAGRVGCTASMLKKVERGERMLSPALAERIRSVLGESPSSLPEPVDRVKALTLPTIGCRLILGHSRAVAKSVGALLDGEEVLYGGSSAVALTAFSSVQQLLRALTLLKPTVPCAVHASLSEGPMESAVASVQFLLSLGSPGTITTDELAAALLRQHSSDFDISALGQFHRADGTVDAVHRMTMRNGAEPRPMRSALPFLTGATVGRDEVVTQVAASCRAKSHRPLVLSGTGGVGKTRVAVEVARQLVEIFRVVFLDALEARSTEAFRSNLAAVLGLKDGAGVQSIRESLTASETLLVIDNAEQVPDIIGFLSSLLDDSSVHVLLTSRVPLGPGTRDYTIAPLTVPDRGVSSASMIDSPAVALFLDRARAVRHGFTPSPVDLLTIAEICRQLDGLPVALELVAARLRFTDDVQAILRSLEDHVDPAALSIDERPPGSLGPRPDRHRTLDSTVEWTLSLLPLSLRVLTQSLSVFPVAFAEPTVIDVAQIERLTAAEQLDELVLRGLAVHEPISLGGQRKWRLLRTVRAVVRRRSADFDLTATRSRFQQSVLSSAGDRARELYGALQSAACLALDDDLTDIRTVLQDLSASLEAQDNEAAADLAGRMLRYWIWAGLAEEAVALYATMSDRQISVSARARLANTAGTAVLFQSKFDQARPLLETSLSLWSAANDSLGIADALANLGVLAGMSGDMDRARELTQQSMDRRMVVGDKRGLAISHGNLGSAAFGAGNLNEARRHLGESAAIHRELEDGLLLCEALIDLAIVEEQAGNVDRARALILEAADLGTVSMLGSLAAVAEVGACIAARSGSLPVPAANSVAELLGMSTYLRTLGGATAPPRPAFGVAAELVEQVLGSTRFFRGCESGKKQLDSGVLQRRVLADQIRQKMHAILTNPWSSPSTLTDRELELLRLGADGLTTQQIAKKLFLSNSTVRTHLQSTYRKLDVPNRASAVRRAIELGLL